MQILTGKKRSTSFSMDVIYRDVVEDDDDDNDGIPDVDDLDDDNDGIPDDGNI